jgi:hypothetical protein
MNDIRSLHTKLHNYKTKDYSLLKILKFLNKSPKRESIYFRQTIEPKPN